MPFLDPMTSLLGWGVFAPPSQAVFKPASLRGVCPGSLGRHGEFLSVPRMCLPPALHTLRMTTAEVRSSHLLSRGFRAPGSKRLVAPLRFRLFGEFFSSRGMFGKVPPGPLGVDPSASEN